MPKHGPQPLGTLLERCALAIEANSERLALLAADCQSLKAAVDTVAKLLALPVIPPATLPVEARESERQHKGAGRATRVRAMDARRRLGLQRAKFNQLVSQGLFTVTRDGDGLTCPRSFFVDELDLYLREIPKGFGAAKSALREYRRKLKRA